MSDEQQRSDLGVEEGGGPPVGTAWTLEVAGDEDGWSADLEHAAPLPRVGELLELIQANGSRRTFQVRGVVHVLQPSASQRPLVREERASPNTIVLDDPSAGTPRILRAGLPRVIASPVDLDARED